MRLSPISVAPAFTSRRTPGRLALGPAFARRVSLALILAAAPLASLTVATSASAQEASAQDIAQARQLGGQAQAAFDAGNFAESEKLWNAAARLYSQAPTLTLGLARTQAKLKKYVAAQESYNKIIREWGNVASPPPAFKDALDAAKAEVGAMSAKVGTVVVTVEGPPSPVVTIDGENVPAAALGLKRPVDPGQHAVKATAEGYKPADATFTVAEGGNAEAKLKMEKSADVAVAPIPATNPGEQPGADTGSGGGGSTQKTLAIVAFGVGGAGLVLGAVTGLIASGKASDLEKACPDKSACPADQKDNVDSYNTMGTLSTVGFIVAGVGGITGAILWFTAPKSGSGSAASARYATVPTKSVTVSPYFGGMSAGVTGRF